MFTVLGSVLIKLGHYPVLRLLNQASILPLKRRHGLIQILLSWITVSMEKQGSEYIDTDGHKRVVMMNAGDILFVLNGYTHRFENIGEGALNYLVVFSN